MADKNNKYPKNTEGPFYVDEDCIACDACILVAPDFFAMEEEEGYAFVKRQPKDEKEKELCVEALESCPVGAIGSDG